MESGSAVHLTLPGQRWKRERRSTVLWSLFPGLLAISCIALGMRPWNGGMICAAIMVLMLCGVLPALLYPFLNYAYQKVQLSDTHLTVAEHNQVQTIALADLAMLAIRQDRPRTRRHPAFYSMRFLDARYGELGTLNINVFEATELYTLLDHLRTLAPRLDVDFAKTCIDEIVREEHQRTGAQPEKLRAHSRANPNIDIQSRHRKTRSRTRSG